MRSIRAEVVYTGKSVEKNVWVNFKGDRIDSISGNAKGEKAGEYVVITPAFIDPHCHMGMYRAGEPFEEAETNDQMDAFLPLADALDSVIMECPSFKHSVSEGTLYSCVVPGSGNIVGGMSAFIRNYGKDTSEAFIGRAGIKMAFGHNPRYVRTWKGKRPWARMGAVAMFRERLRNVKIKLDALKGKKVKDAPRLNAEENVYADVLNRKLICRIHVHKADDIAAVLRLIDEFKLKATIEHAMDVHEEGTFKELKKRNIPVCFGPIDCWAPKVELRHETWSNINYLLSSGVEFGLMTDSPVIKQNNFFVAARWFLRCGMDKQGVVELLSRKNAEFLGYDKILGTLERNKWASFVCWNGDPFDISNYSQAAYGEGKLLEFC